MLDLTAKNAETNFSRIRSCRHVLKTAGIPYTESTSVSEAINYPVIFISPVIYSTTFSSSEKQLLIDYVNQGGVLIASSLRDPALYGLFGVSGYTNYTLLTTMTWEADQFPQYFDRFDDPNEINVSLSGPTTSTDVFTIRPYTLAGGQSMAHFENNLPGGVVMNQYGSGRTFLFSIDLRDVLIRNFINSDLNANRTYSNGFEPTSDTFIFFITNIINEHIPHMTRVHSCPDCESSVVMITHDIDSRTAMDTMVSFVNYEEANQLNAMYNVTVRIYHDDWMSDFYLDSYDKVEYAKLHGQKLASHSLGHFPDFASTTLFPLGTMGNTPDNYMPLYLNDTTSGGSVYGEVEVSKYLIESDHNVQVKSFRAGHLAYNRRLPKALYDLGYLYNSSFSANDVLTNFPFYDIDNLSFSGDQLPVLEIPMTISDAAACCPFTQENALERAALWADITIKNNNNGAPTVLLIHPNRSYKLTAEQFYVNALPGDVRYMFLDDFGDYWKKRETANVVTEYNNDSLIVHFNGFQMYSNLSLVVNDASQLASIRFFDANNMELFPQSLNVDYNETRYCHFVYSDNVEICNGQDDDGDGWTDENLSYTQYQDLDQDGYGNQAITLLACTSQSGFVTNALDCDDSSTVIHPNNAEYCDSLDNNCNGLVDEGLDWNTYYWDADQDGFGNNNVAVTTCLSPVQYILQNGDCDDENGLINPAQSEVCNDADDNCDGGIDEGLAFVTYYEDLDHDGFGNDSVSVLRCVLPFGFVFQHGDCNDNHANVNPQSIEQCGDNLDNDCDGEVDEVCVIDMDEDGYDVLQDCDDENPWAYPGANEICGNNIDEDCNGVDLICPIYGCTDATAFNYNPAANTDDGSCIAVVNGCTDATAFNYNPAANTDDGSCVPIILGCIASNACNYNNQANTSDGSCVFPQQEICNQLDDDCDGIVDNGLPYLTYFPDIDGDGQGSGMGWSACSEPGPGYVQISGDCNDEDANINGQAMEVCDAWDNDCDGLINEGLQSSDIVSVNVSTAVYPTCTTGNLFAANFNNGSNSLVVPGNGPDLWYKLQPQFNTLRVGLSAASGVNSVAIYQDFGGCLQLMESESEVTSGNQTLLTDDLIPGNIYYIVAHQISAPTNTSAKICFNHLVSTTCDHVYSNNTGVYSSVCSSFKAVYKTYATQYIFNVMGASQSGQNLLISPWSYAPPSSSSIVSRLGSIFPVNQGASNITYTLTIPVVYGLTDAAGNLSLLTAQGSNTCNVTLTPEAAVVLRSADRCPAIKAINQSIVTDRTVCGAARYEWEFTQVLPNPQPPVSILGGLNTNALFLNAVPGMANGKTYNVRVRPIHGSGMVGDFGTSYCLKTTGAVMALEGSNDGPLESFATELTDFVLYPNPSNQDHITIFWSAFQDDVKHIVLRDMQGRVIRNEKIAVSGNSVEFNMNSIEAGVYILEINEVGVRVIRTR